MCEVPSEMAPGEAAWQALVEDIHAVGPDLVLLNEMPFGGWIATTPQSDHQRLAESHRMHEGGAARLADLDTPNVLSTQAKFAGRRSVNEAFVWSATRGLTPVHTKQFFPNEAGFYEAEWFERGELRFRLAEVDGLRVGFLICTDVMFLEWARHYGRSGAHLIAVPRATPAASLERWKTVISGAAIVSGCYVASSNRNGMGESGIEFGGRGWIFAPSGELIAETSQRQPVAVADIDPAAAEKAQSEYPCYVEE